MLRSAIRFLSLGLGVLATPALLAQGISVRVTPPQKAQFLQFQRFDIRVEATAQDATAQVKALTVAIDGVDVTARGVADSPSPLVRNWTFRNAALGLWGPRVITASATGTSGSISISGSGTSALTIRAWDPGLIRTSGAAEDTFPELAAIGGRIQARAEMERDQAPSVDELHLGANHPAFSRPASLADAPLHRAKNVILLIGDGMGIAHRTGGRVLSKGYTQGKANGTLAMDRLPFNGMLMTSSLNSLITDSAPGAHNYSTGNKTNNGMEGVFPDNTADEGDNPRLEYLSEFTARFFGKVTGIVTDAFLTDATPAAFLAHTSNRNNGTLIASQYFDLRKDSNLRVLMGGGGYHFIPKSQTGSRRTDERNVVSDFKNDGWSYVETAAALNGFTAGPNARLFGLFNIDNMDVAFDKLKLGDPTNVAAYPDQPFLKDMAKKAIDVLKQYPNGFFLMVEGAHIDKQAHRMDAERALYDVIQFDQAVQVALDFALQTNSDDDPDNDTLVIVSADHECSGMALPGVGRPEKKGTRDYVKTYNYGDGVVLNDSKTLNFTDYVDANGDGYPDNPDTGRKLIVNFGAAPDHYEDWQSSLKFRDPGAVVSGVVVANPNDPKKSSPGVLVLTGVIENGASGGENQTQAVHTLSDIPISAYGPGASQFARVTDNTEAFFSIFNSMLGVYPVPTQF